MVFLARHGPKRAITCGHQKFKSLQVALLENQEIKCAACQEMLTECKFSNEALQTCLLDRVERKSHLQERLQSVAPTADFSRKVGPNKSDGKEDPEKEADDGIDEEQAIDAFCKSVEHVITFLPAGSFGRKLPYRCKVCRTSGFPQGKIGELGRRRLYNFQHFIGIHLDSDMHRRYMAANEVLHVSEQLVECDGLSIKDATAAGRLHKFHSEFSVWATFANLPELAQHTYWQDANKDTWFVRSKNCLKELPDPGHGFSRVCTNCRKLADGHSVPRKHLGTSMHVCVHDYEGL